MADEVQKGVRIGDPSDPMRMLGRLARLKQSISRATGERKAEMQAEIDRHEAALSALRNALAEASDAG